MPVEEYDMVSQQANMSAQIAIEKLAASKWWEDYGLCYIEGSKMEDFTFENRIKFLKESMNSEKFAKVKLHTTNQNYGKGKEFISCGEKYHGIKRDHTIG